VKYLLDTNACIALINAKPAMVREHFEEEVSIGSTAHVSSIVIFELQYGIAKSTRRHENKQNLSKFLSGPVNLLAYDEDDAAFSGDLRAAMESIGRPIGDYDLLIAGQALRHGMTLVTANEKEFGRVPNLLWENWSRR
jgi:tRNA(fMet)-specific endonuclease VapC